METGCSHFAVGARDELRVRAEMDRSRQTSPVGKGTVLVLLFFVQLNELFSLFSYTREEPRVSI